jgi:hypothetical protein
MIRVTAVGTQRQRSLQAFRTKQVVRSSRRSNKYRAFQFRMASLHRSKKDVFFLAGLYFLALASAAQKTLVSR